MTNDAPASPPSIAPCAAIVGGGPAGLFAAEILAARGAAVTVFEAKPSPARKLLMAGRGGLNLTHSEPLSRFSTRYGAHAAWFADTLAAFPPDALRTWCPGLGCRNLCRHVGPCLSQQFQSERTGACVAAAAGALGRLAPYPPPLGRLWSQQPHHARRGGARRRAKAYFRCRPAGAGRCFLAASRIGRRMGASSGGSRRARWPPSAPATAAFS